MPPVKTDVRRSNPAWPFLLRYTFCSIFFRSSKRSANRTGNRGCNLPASFLEKVGPCLPHIRFINEISTYLLYDELRERVQSLSRLADLRPGTKNEGIKRSAQTRIPPAFSPAHLFSQRPQGFMCSGPSVPAAVERFYPCLVPDKGWCAEKESRCSFHQRLLLNAA